jgi:eukaryotic-like serine/threonine-protein kinase
MKEISDTAASRLQRLLLEPDLTDTKYKLMKKLGSGGMAEVYLVHDTELDRQAALKVIDSMQPDEEIAMRLLREAQVIAQLEHPAIVPVHDVGTLADGRVFYVMKYVQGERLDAHARKIQSLSDRLLIFLRICDAVAFAHSRGILHLDLKPQNIMVGAFGEVQVMDWGLARILNETDSIRMILGTPGYMAPEQSAAENALMNEKTDVYGLGAIVYYLITLAEPDVASKPRQLNPAIRRPLEAICLKAMAVNPEVRYANASALSRDITCYLSGQPVSAYRENVFEKTARFLSRNSFFVYLFLTYLLIRALLLLFLRHPH